MPVWTTPVTEAISRMARVEPSDFQIDGMRFLCNDFAVPGADCRGVLQTT